MLVLIIIDYRLSSPFPPSLHAFRALFLVMTYNDLRLF